MRHIRKYDNNPRVAKSHCVHPSHDTSCRNARKP